MAQQTILLGTVANDRTGDPLRTAFDKCNDNFDELYSSNRDLVCQSITVNGLRLEYDVSNYASFTVSSSGVLTLTTSANRIALGASRTPASATASGTAGEVCWDANYVYICVAANTWRRAALSSW